MKNNKSEDVYLLIYVHSALNNFEHRATIRRTWGNVSSYESLATVRLVFVTGLQRNETIQQMVENESSQYNDIVQENFVDVYRNLTYKAVAALKWITENCFRNQDPNIRTTGPR